MNRALQVLLAVSLPFFVLGCAAHTGMDSENLGSMKENNEITRQYEDLIINPDYDYYYYGREIQPDAILGVMNNYSVDSNFWHPVQLTRDQLETWVAWGKRGRHGQCASPRYMGHYRGADISDPSGNIIGNWYSKRDWGIFEFPGSNTVIPHPPRNREGWSIETCT